MTFEEWLKTATKRDGSPLSEKTVKHYADGFRITSKEMLDTLPLDIKHRDEMISDMNERLYLMYDTIDEIQTKLIMLNNFVT